MEETKVIYYIDDEETPYLVKIPISPEKVTLLDFKNQLNRPNYKFFFKSMDDDFGVVKEEIVDDNAHLPCFNGRVVSWLVSAEGSNPSDGASQCTDSNAGKTKQNIHGAPTVPLTRDTCTDTDSTISSRPGHRASCDKYKYRGLRINGHSKYGNHGLEYETASVLSSDLDSTSLFDSQSEITTTTGRHTNASVDRALTECSSVSHLQVSSRKRPQRRRKRPQVMSRTSSYSSITDSTMSMHIITVISYKENERVYYPDGPIVIRSKSDDGILEKSREGIFKFYRLSIMESAGDWCLIESDPGVFTELIKKFGVKGVQVEEMWSIDAATFESLRPVHGLIFLFKYLQHEEPSNTVVTDDRLEKIYFAKQVINNACATQAVISLLLNCNHPDVWLGPELTKLKEFSMSFDPKMRGLTLSNSQTIRNAHNSMSQPTLFEFDPKMAAKEEDAYHFVGYMPIHGRLYELDGLRDGPIDHGPIAPEQDWLDLVRPIILNRINTYLDDEIHFNLMALVSDRKMVYERKIFELTDDTRALGMDTDDIENEIRNLQMLIEYEDKKMMHYQQELARRRHNYLPFIITLLQILAETKKLMPLYEKAKERALKKEAKKQKA